MSKYTMQLREIYSPTPLFEDPFYTKNDVIGWFEDYELTDFLTTDEISVINARGTWTKHKLATKIVDHYFMEEIGFETMELFRLRTKSFMQEIMEEYLPLIYSASIEYDPLVNVDYEEKFSRSALNSGTNSSSTSSSTASSNTSSGLNVASDTPQGQITKANILNGSYATSTDANESTSTDSITNMTSGNGTNNNTLSEMYTKQMKGNSGVSATAQKMIEQYRNNIRAIDREIINKCKVLFMCVR